jgi:hypothetical protein
MLYGSLSATNLGDFAGYWEGTESLSSPTMSIEGREVYISLRHNASLDNNLLYNSNSDFIYNGYLDWAAHRFTYNKSENQVTFERRFTTPLGILGSQELVYNILENDGERIFLEFISEDGLTIHTLNISLTILSNGPEIFSQTVSLEPNYPNPFNPSTSIPVTILSNTYTRLSVYNSNGKLVKEIQNGLLQPGQYIFKWNGSNEKNMAVSAGTYIYKLSHGNNTIVRKMILLK